MSLQRETAMRSIGNEADYDAALAAVDRLMGSAPGTAEGHALETLVALIERYEAEHWKVGPPASISE